MRNASRKGSEKHEEVIAVDRSPEQPESYVLRGGQAGAARLRIISRAKWPTTEQVLGTAGLRVGMRVLDAGCGGGAVALRMGALVATEGEVVGVDLDPSILRLAQREAEGSNLPVTFATWAPRSWMKWGPTTSRTRATCSRTYGSRSGSSRPWYGR